MWERYSLLAIAPVLGLAVYCLTHVLLCRLALRRGHYLPLAVGACCGLIGTLGISAGALVGMGAGLGDAVAMFVLNFLTYLALAFGYFNFINLNIASLRIRMLEELLASGGSMPRARLLAQYNTDHVISLRIARLTRGGHLREERGRYYRGKVVRFLIVARVFDILHWIILGPGHSSGHGTGAKLHAAKIEGAP